MIDLKESAFSSVEEQRQRATCAHVWEEFVEPAWIFGYLVVEAKCPACRTYRGSGAHDATPARERKGAA